MHTFICYLKLAKAHVKGRLIHPWSVVVYIFGLALAYISSFLGVWVVLNKFGGIKNWDFGEIVLIYVICLMSYGVRCWLFTQFIHMGYLIQRGEIDRVLTKPLNPLVWIMGNRFEIGGFAHVSAGLLILILFRSEYDVIWNATNITYFVLAVLSSALVQGAITVAIGASSFFLFSTQGLNEFYQSLRDFIFYPATLYNKAVQFVLFFIIPLAFASYVPAGTFLNNPEYQMLPKWVWQVSLLSGVIFFALAYAFWNKGIDHYQSSGN